ncbi:MAG: heparinase II/III family protein [Nitrospirae bacterium]|nr:heparinase II/III family protein [Nitrospirota bacterium]MBF0534106.1 heparinase II/III family protein [Nitrospirota bacterium]MBF0616993.1 heparinase II/III family protein [Nitrospirota bacterium]
MPQTELRRRVKQRLNRLFLRVRDFFLPTSTNKKLEITNRFVTIKPNNNAAFKQISYTLKHKFNTLASGWTEASYGTRCKGLHGNRYNSGKQVKTDINGMWLLRQVNIPNFFRSKRLWMLIDGTYTPIDWQLDFKSGFRWSERKWYNSLRTSNKPGVDIKVPWELARFQHLPPLALACFTNGAAEFSHKRLAAEFQNQVLDFAAVNPPRFGVNWRCGMDAAIRAANLLLTYDLFSLAGILFGEGFNKAFGQLIYGHGVHIINNLSWSQNLRGNHYLAEITGLLFISAYLPPSDETDCWFAFSVCELIKEVEFQFNTDGTHFESSTAYHCLCTELVLYATALVLGICTTERINSLKNYNHKLHRVYPRLLPSPVKLYPMKPSGLFTPFPPAYFTKLYKMGAFITDILKPDGVGKIPQIGDNDSGRLFKLSTKFKTLSMDEAVKTYKNLEGFNADYDGGTFLDEESPDYSGVVSAFKGLFEPAKTDNTEAILIRNYSGGVVIPNDMNISSSLPKEYGTSADLQKLINEFNKTDDTHKDRVLIPVKNSDVLKRLTLRAYPDFGLYIFKADGLYLAVRCGSVDSRYNGAHAHNDQLSVELSVEEVEIFRDPGGYLYTPEPQLRNRFRSVSSHFAPQLQSKKEPGDLSQGLFELRDRSRSECIYFGTLGFAGVHYGFGAAIYRVVKFGQGEIEILDFYKGTEPIRKFSSENIGNYDYSKGYGILQ